MCKNCNWENLTPDEAWEKAVKVQVKKNKYLKIKKLNQNETHGKKSHVRHQK